MRYIATVENNPQSTIEGEYKSLKAFRTYKFDKLADPGVWYTVMTDVGDGFYEFRSKIRV